MALKTGSVQTGICLLNNIFRKKVSLCIRPGCEASFVCRQFSDKKIQVPKRPLTAFFDFLTQKRDEIRRNNPEAKVNEVASIAGQMWRQTNIEEKQILQEKASRRMEAYKVEREKFLSQLTDAEKEELIKSKQEHKKKLQHRRQVTEFHKLGKPKKAVTPFVCYVRSSKMERGDAPAKYFLKGLAERWKLLPVEDKEVYSRECDVDRDRYYQEMEIWEAKMLEAGRPDLLRGYQKKKPVKRKSKGRRKSRPSTKSSRKTTEDLSEEVD